MKFYKHPAYVGYANSPDMTKDDRYKEWEKQFKERGFDDTVTWSFDYMIVQWITPRLERFLEISEEITDAPEFHDAVREMLVGFKLYISDDFNEFDKEQLDKVNKSFQLLAENYRGLWW